jgi:hypothetical protein
MRWGKVPVIAFFSENTATFIHELAPDAHSTAGGAGNHVRVNVTANAGTLDREQQLGLVRDLTALTEAVPGGWGIAGHAYTNEEIVAHVRTLLGKEQTSRPGTFDAG